MDSHDAKLEELENLVKGQAELIDELKSKQVELTSALESKQVQLEQAIADSKVQAAKELSDVKVALEQSQETAKVNLASGLERVENRAKLSEERQVGLAKQLLAETLPKLTQKLLRKEEFQQFQNAWLTRMTATDKLLASFEVSLSRLYKDLERKQVSTFYESPLLLVVKILLWLYQHAILKWPCCQASCRVDKKLAKMF